MFRPVELLRRNPDLKISIPAARTIILKISHVATPKQTKRMRDVTEIVVIICATVQLW
jgi:hypothetical protein